MAGADSTTVFIVVPVDDVVAALNAPMFSVVAKDLFRIRLISRDAGDAMDDFLAHLACFLLMVSRCILKAWPTWGKFR